MGQCLVQIKRQKNLKQKIRHYLPYIILKMQIVISVQYMLGLILKKHT